MGRKGGGGQNVLLKIQTPLISNVLDHKEGRNTILSYGRRPFVWLLFHYYFLIALLFIYIFKHLCSYADMPLICHIDKTKICRVTNIFVLTLSSYLISISPWICHKINVTLL